MVHQYYITAWYLREARIVILSHFFIFDYIFINNDLVAPLNPIADMHMRAARNNTMTTLTGPYSYTLFTKHLQYITANQTKTHAQLVSSQMVQSQTYTKKFTSVAFNLLPLYSI